MKKGGVVIKYFKKISFKLLIYRQINKKHLAANQTVCYRGKNVVYLIAVIAVALFCFVGCSNENQTKQLTTKPPLTNEVIEETLKNHSNNWKRYDVNIDAETAAQVITNIYGFDDGDGLRLFINTYKKEGATYLNISLSPQRYISGEEPKFIKEKLPDMFAVACELYGDGIDPKEFEEFWDFYKSKKGLIWRKVVGDNIIYVRLRKDDIMNFTTVSSVSIQKKSWEDWLNIITIKSMLWGNQDVSIEEHISTTGDITGNKAVPIKSCYIVNGGIVGTKKLTELANLPDEKEIFSKLHYSYLIPKTGEYNVATIEDSTGKIEVIMPSLQISESEFKEFKYFLVYEYTTDKGRAFYLLAATRSLNSPTFK
ncbi:MAG: hypothetical protein F8N39_19305 [Clostridiaceae bacterium]|nr:hypothetical protein [Clostridiaceae bacterium]